MSSATTDSELCRASAGGDPRAFTALVHRYQGLVCAITYAATGTREQSEDLAQETFLVAWKKVASLEQPDRVAGWLVAVARNLSRNTRRKQPPGVLDDEEGLRDPSEGADVMLEAHDQRAQVWRLLDNLPPTYREVMVLYYREDQSATRVASLLSLSLSAVQQRLSRGRKLLRDEFEAELARELLASRPGSAFTQRVAAVLPLGGVGLSPAIASPLAPLTPATAVVSRRSIALVLASAVVGTLLLTRAHSERRTSPEQAAPAANPTVRVRAQSNVETTSVAGLVVSTQKHQPLAGATIVVEPARGALDSTQHVVVRSREDGEWSLEGLASGNYRLTASAAGHLSASQAMVVMDGRRSQAPTLELDPGGITIEGVIADLTGGAISGAWVRAMSGPSAVATAVSDDEGRYRLTVPPGTYRVQTRDEAYEDAEQQVWVVGDPPSVDFALIPAATIAGRVIERSTGRAVEGAKVAFTVRQSNGDISSYGVSNDDQIATTNRDGRFELRRLPAGEYELYASGDHLWSKNPIAMSVGLGDPAVEVSIPVDPAFIVSGRIVDADDPNLGIEGARVGVPTDWPSFFVRSDADGRFVLPGRPPGVGSVSVKAEGWVEASGTLAEVVDGDVTLQDIELRRGTVLEGSVTPPGVVTVTVAWREVTTLSQVSLEDRTTRTSADGRFVIHAIPTGDLRVTAIHQEGQRAVADVTIEEGDTTEHVELTLVQSPIVRGIVLDPEGRPLPGATVHLATDGDPDFAAIDWMRAKKVLTDERGEFTIPFVDPGKYWLSASERGVLLPQVGVSPKDDRGLGLVVGDAGVEQATLRVEAAKLVLGGVVLDHHATPHPDAVVTLEEDALLTSAGISRTTVADAYGRFGFEGLPPATYVLSARSRDQDARSEAQRSRPGEPIEIRLLPLATVSGRVTLAGRPVTDFRVGIGKQLPRTVSTADGRFSLGHVEPGEQELLITSDDGVLTRTITVEAGETWEAAFELHPWTMVVGRVLGADGRPLSQHPLSLFAQGGDRDRHTRVARAWAAQDPLVTDADGRFSIPGIGPGHVDLIVGQAILDTSGTPLERLEFDVVEGEEVHDLGDIVVDPSP